MTEALAQTAAFSPIVAVLAGLLIGSFLNACIYRLPRDISMVRPRSHCPWCERTIAWYDNIPVLSWLLLRGRCRHCQSSIPVRYLVVELATGAAFLFCEIAFGPTITAVKFAVFAAIIIALIVTDLQDRILPDEFTLGGIAIGLAFAPFGLAEPGILSVIFWNKLSPVFARLLDASFAAVFASGLIWFVAWAWQKIRQREGGWMGLGDVKMLAMIGAFLGFQGSLLTMFVGSLLGSVIGYGYIRLFKKDPSSYELPLGSFLGAGALIVAIWLDGLGAWRNHLGR